jgi:hypothetical protein
VNVSCGYYVQSGSVSDIDQSAGERLVTSDKIALQFDKEIVSSKDRATTIRKPTGSLETFLLEYTGDYAVAAA